MSQPNLVEHVLGWLYDNWRETEADRPVLINRDDASIYEETSVDGATVGDSVGITVDERSVSIDLAQGRNAIGVAQGSYQTTAVGTEFDYKVVAEVDVRIEGLHEDEWGNVANDEDWRAFVNEARHAILLERTWPLPTFHTLTISNDTDQSSTHKDYYRRDLTFEFRGYEDLP